MEIPRSLYAEKDSSSSFTIIDSGRAFPVRPISKSLKRPLCVIDQLRSHLDHAHGNAAYAEMFGSRIDIVSTDFSRAALDQAAIWFSSFLQGKSLSSAQMQEVPNQGAILSFVQTTLAV